VRYEREADIRYTMQMAEVSTPVPVGPVAAEHVEQVGRDFENRYESLYGKGSGFPDAGLQLITYRVRAVGTLQIQPELPEHAAIAGPPVPSGERPVFLDVRIGRQPATIYDYRSLGAGHEITGPAVVEAPTTTVALPPGTRARVDRLGNLVMRFATPTMEQN
jgi:N-methylhydantoinase A